MNELITDVKALYEETLNNLKNSKANSTIRAYKSDFKDFGAFCAKNGFKSLPTEPKIISLYLTQLSMKDAKMSTLRRRLVSIGVIHKLKGLYLDTKHPIIIENLMGISRKKGNYQRGKKPILINQLKAIINVIDNAKKGIYSEIILKLNSFTSYKFVDKLYEASQHGVKIKLLIRGICCLIPNKLGFSDNIEVKSVVDRYLEHSRVYVFENGGDKKQKKNWWSDS